MKGGNGEAKSQLEFINQQMLMVKHSLNFNLLQHWQRETISNDGQRWSTMVNESQRLSTMLNNGQRESTIVNDAQQWSTMVTDGQ